MDSSGLKDLFRSQMADAVDPPLWSDAEIFGYMDDAQKMFCRAVGGIADATSDFTLLALEAGNDWVSISPLILKIKRATLLSDGRSLEVASFDRLAGEGFRFDNRTRPKPSLLVLGLDENKGRVYPVPSAETTESIQLFVERLPLLTIDDTDQALEIPEQHHPHLLLWMKHRALAKQDADTYDRAKSVDFKAQALEYMERARRERDRVQQTPRQMAYGGPNVGVAHGSFTRSRGRTWW